MLAPAAAPAASGGELAWRPDRTLVRLSPWSGEVIALARAGGADELCMLSAGGRLTRVAETGPWRLKQLWWVAPRVQLATAELDGSERCDLLLFGGDGRAGPRRVPADLGDLRVVRAGYPVCHVAQRRDGRLRRLLRLDLRDGAATRVADFDADRVLLSATGGTALLTRTADRGLEFMALRTGPGTRVATSLPGSSLLTDEPVAIGDDAVIDMRGQWQGAAALYRLALATGERELTAAAPGRDIAWVQCAAGRPWAWGLTEPVSLPRGLTPGAAAELAGCRTALRGDRVSRARILTRQASGMLIEAHPDGAAPRLRHWAPGGEVTDLGSTYASLDGARLAPRRPFTVTADDGLRLAGYVTVPDPAADRHLGVLAVHGGPWARDKAGFDPVAQWLARLGLTVLQVNYRGSTGGGPALLDAGDRQWGAMITRDLRAAVRWGEDQGFFRRGACVAFGLSAGGAEALQLAAQFPDLVSRVVSAFAPVNLFHLLDRVAAGGSPEQRALYRRRIGDRASSPAALRAGSPAFIADRVRCPTLLVRGMRDPRVPAADIERFWRAQRAAGTPSTLISFGDEGHGVRQWPNRSRFVRVVTEFVLAGSPGAAHG
jgi:dienelactone hydrolase